MTNVYLTLKLHKKVLIIKRKLNIFWIKCVFFVSVCWVMGLSWVAWGCTGHRGSDVLQTDLYWYLQLQRVHHQECLQNTAQVRRGNSLGKMNPFFLLKSGKIPIYNVRYLTWLILLLDLDLNGKWFTRINSVCLSVHPLASSSQMKCRYW